MTCTKNKENKNRPKSKVRYPILAEREKKKAHTEQRVEKKEIGKKKEEKIRYIQKEKRERKRPRAITPVSLRNKAQP